MKLHLAVAFLLATGALADPIETCSDQAPCISATITQDDPNSVSCNLGECVYKICIKDDRSVGCAKGDSSQTWSHICDGSDSTISDGHENDGLWEGCPNPTDDSLNFWDTDEATSESDWEMCQHVKGGEIAYFVLKDGAGCGADGALPGEGDTYDLGGLEAFCAPSEAHATAFEEETNGNNPNVKYKTCSGNTEGMECVWQITAPPCTEETTVVEVVEEELVTERSGAFGDPHLRTWTGQTYDFHGQCDLILASSPSFDHNKGFDAHIRTEIRDDWSYVSAAAIRIGDDILEVSGRGAYSLNGVPNADLSQGISGYRIKSKMMKQGDSIRGKFRIGMKTWGTVNIKIYNEFLAVSIRRRSKGFEDSVGLMGTFSEGLFMARDQVTVFEDPNDFGKNWQVRHDDPMLFHEAAFPQYPTECIMPTPAEMENRRRLSEGSEGGAGMIPHSEAEKACSHMPAGPDREACVYDVLLTGDLNMADFDADFDSDDEDF